MTFAIPPNTTCDIYRLGRAPPDPPDVAGVLAALLPRLGNLKADVVYTHWIDLPLTTDVRTTDLLFVPDQMGTKFSVVAWQRLRLGGSNDCKRAYLNRQAVTWPTQEL